jgi:tRNA pseudouridine55 synthase
VLNSKYQIPNTKRNSNIQAPNTRTNTENLESADQNIVNGLKIIPKDNLSFDIRNSKFEISEGLWKVYKPVGWTSFDVVARIRSLTGIKKVGHAGTLDPAAEGLLLVAVGRSTTRELEHLLLKDKEYIAEITLGISTDSGDRDGIILEKHPVSVTRAQVETALQKLGGIQEQVPPMYSAIKHKGRKLYELARKGIEVERRPRTIEIKEVELLSWQDGEFPVVQARFLCSKGTYIRVLAEQLGKYLDCGAFLSGLKRTKIGEYTLDNAIKIEELKNS